MGGFTLQEFLGICNDLTGPDILKTSPIDELLEALDSEGHGYLSRAEFVNMLSSWGQAWPIDVAESTVQKIMGNEQKLDFRSVKSRIENHLNGS